MTAEESLSVAVRGHLSGAGAMSEVKMFGGTGFFPFGPMSRSSNRTTQWKGVRQRGFEQLASRTPTRPHG